MGYFFQIVGFSFCIAGGLAIFSTIVYIAIDETYRLFDTIKNLCEYFFYRKEFFEWLSKKGVSKQNDENVNQ